MSENILTSNSLPTQPSEAHRWEEWPHPPLTLRDAGPVSLSQPQPGKRSAVIALVVPRRGSGLRRQFLLLAALTVLCFVCYRFVSRHVATAVIVQGRSMMPTLHDGDRFILNRLSYFRHAPQRGDVVVV